MKPYYETENGVLYCGDCLTIMPELEPVDLVITSPPYNMRTCIRNGEYATREKTAHFSKKYEYFDDAMSIEDYYQFHKAALKEMLRLSPLVFWNISIVTGSKEAVFHIIGDFNKEIKDIIVWNKGHGQPAMHEGVLNRGYELILILERNAKAGRCFDKSYFKRGEMQDVWNISKGKSYKENKACFPMWMVMKIINGWSCTGSVIFDPFFGAGTVGKSCERLNRKWVGIELTKECCERAAKRIENERKQLKLF
jgi:site-specific DNA-methyltransferase (adenine-specific)